MPSQTTLQENIRTPIDGTEWVRLSTGTFPTGLNFRGQLSSIFGSLVVAAGPVNSVQFNNPLGTFAGSGDLTWTVGASSPATPFGLTLGGATQIAGNAVAGTGEHMAVGNYGIIDLFTENPGDGSGGQFSFAANCPLLVCQHFPDISGGQGATGIAASFNGKSVSGGALIGLQMIMSTDGSSTASMSGITGLSFISRNFNAFTVANMVGANCQVINGGGNISGDLAGGTFSADNNRTGSTVSGNIIGGAFGGTIDKGFCSGILAAGHFVAMNNAASTPDQRGIWISASGVSSSATNAYGVYVEDQTGTGTSISDNIRSKGVSSTNVFEGSVITTPSLVSALPSPSAALQGARRFVTDASVVAAGNFGTIVAGLGGNPVPVYCDGTNWRIG